MEELQAKIEALEAEKAEMAGKLETLEGENKAHQDIQADLVKKLEEKTSEASIGRPIVKVGKHTYAIQSAVRVGGKVYSASDLQNKKHIELVKKLIERKSEIIKLVK